MPKVGDTYNLHVYTILLVIPFYIFIFSLRHFYFVEGQHTRRAPIIVSAGTLSSEMTSPSKNVSGIAKSVIVRASYSSNPSNSTTQVSFDFDFFRNPLFRLSSS